jgi:hypothetical protein
MIRKRERVNIQFSERQLSEKVASEESGKTYGLSKVQNW